MPWVMQSLHTDLCLPRMANAGTLSMNDNEDWKVAKGISRNTMGTEQFSIASIVFASIVTIA